MPDLAADGLLFFLQSSDTLFPTGAYAHSLGMEEMIRDGAVTSEATLLEFLQQHILPATQHLDLPLVAWAHRAAAADDRSALRDTDILAGALRPARELRAASLQIGRRRLAMLAAVRPTPLLLDFQAQTLDDPQLGHATTVWGAACSPLPIDSTLQAFFYQAVSCFCGAAPKLLRIGQEAAQRVLTAALQDAHHIVQAALHIPKEDIGFFDPILDLASMRHELASERLFIS